MTSSRVKIKGNHGEEGSEWDVGVECGESAEDAKNAELKLPVRVQEWGL